MPLNNPDIIAEKMAALRINYRNQLAERLPQIEHIAAQDTWQPAHRQELLTHAHQLAGNGATFGFPTISDTGRILEEQLIDHMAQAPEFFRPALHALLAACRDAMEISAAATSASAPSTPETSSPTTMQKHRPTLLLVDDDATLVTMLSQLLHDSADITIASNGTEALARINEHAPDLLLLDNTMPGEISGFGLLEQMQSTPELRTIPVIMMTASDSPEEVMRGLMAGACDYITKPFEAESVLAKIRGRLQRLQSTILIADDDAAIRELLVHKFQGAGCKVAVAIDGAEAWDTLQRKSISLAVLDRMMPGFDGMTLLNMMKKTPAMQHIPVVFLTARHYGADVLEGINTGAAEYITKPFNPDEVVARCLRLVKAE